VTEQFPSVTVVVAARPGQAEVQAVTASRRLDYPPEKLEIIVARGKQPSAQRNAALQAARGEVIYFLDDDSVAEPSNLRRAAAYFKDPQVKMVGGPNLCPPEAPPLEQVFALVLASWLAFGPSRARYDAVGEVRATSEKELILCNLAARKGAMLELGGFNEALYPNEENALMDELQKRGGKLLYDPEFTVQRRPRSDLRAFARMLRTYGRGRAEQFRLHPTAGSVLNFVPPLFLLYLVALPFLVGLFKLGKFFLIPLAFYLLIVLGQGMALAPKARAASRRSPVAGPAGEWILRSIGTLPLMVLTHVLYGWGFWRGLFTPLKTGQTKVPVEVVLEKVPLKDDGAK
jgi:succinoglycan biosynthesis protein ExoA